MRLSLPATPLFDRPPPGGAETLASRLEPLAMTGSLLGISLALEGPLRPVQMGAGLLMLALSYPGPVRRRQPRSDAPRAIGRPRRLARAWLGRFVLDVLPLAAVLLLCGWAAGLLGPPTPDAVFSPPVILAWLLGAPALPWLVHTACGRAIGGGAAPGGSVLVIGSGEAAERVRLALGERGSHAPAMDTSTPIRCLAHEDRHAVDQALRQPHLSAVYLVGSPSGSEFEGVLQALRDSTAAVHWVPDFGSVAALGVIQGRLSTLGAQGELPVISLLESPFSGWPGVVKRISDVVLAGFALALLWPLMGLIALVIKLDSPGPVLFRQRRHGLGGLPIEVWKFRTMRTLDNGAVVRQATPGDARITRVGRFLRRTSLDELPQFLNVLQGRMSVVGPRPHAWAHNEHYRGLIDAYMLRHKVRPGITGWAQVNGWRGETRELAQMQARVAHDLAYLRHWSLGLDLRIVALTALRMWSDDKAW